MIQTWKKILTVNTNLFGLEVGLLLIDWVAGEEGIVPAVEEDIVPAVEEDIVPAAEEGIDLAAEEGIDPAAEVGTGSAAGVDTDPAARDTVLVVDLAVLAEHSYCICQQDLDLV